MKRLVIVIGSLARGGTETHLIRTLPLLKQAGYDILVYCYRARGELATTLDEADIPVLEPSPGRFPVLRAMFFFLPFLYQKKPDLLHFFLPASYLLFAPLSFFYPWTRRVMSRRSSNDYQRKYPVIVKWLEMGLHRCMHGIMTNSGQAKRQLVEQEYACPNKIVVVYNGIKTPPKTEPDDGSRSFDGIVRMIIVANLIPYKGHMDLLKACSLLRNKNWSLAIVGADSSGILPAIEAEITRLGIAENVQLLGKRNDISQLLSVADIGLLVSHEEGFSNALLEYMAAGLPVIVTDVGGNSEAVIDGEQGLVVPPCKPTELSISLQRLMDDPLLRRAMGQRALSRAQNTFSLEAGAKGYVEFYRSLMEEQTS